MPKPVPAFHPFTFPQPNMLVQPGSEVVIDGLTSAAGQQLNGSKGTALKFFPETARWSVQIDVEEEEEKTEHPSYRVVKIHISNLCVPDGDRTMICHFPPSHPSWFLMSENGTFALRVGTMGKDGPLALCFLSDFPVSDSQKTRMSFEASFMGVPQTLISTVVEKYPSLLAEKKKQETETPKESSPFKEES